MTGPTGAKEVRKVDKQINHVCRHNHDNKLPNISIASLATMGSSKFEVPPRLFTINATSFPRMKLATD